MSTVPPTERPPDPRHPHAATPEEREAFKKNWSRPSPRSGQSTRADDRIWATDEHRIGLKPIMRGVWAPNGERPVAIGHHRFSGST